MGYRCTTTLDGMVGEGDRMARNIVRIEARLPMCRGNRNEENVRDDDVG